MPPADPMPTRRHGAGARAPVLRVRHAAPVPPSASPFPGSPFPLGATLSDRGANFAVVADGAESVELCLVDALGAERRMPMQDRRYGIWHTFVPGVRAGQRYGYRVGGRDRVQDPAGPVRAAGGHHRLRPDGRVGRRGEHARARCRWASSSTRHARARPGRGHRGSTRSIYEAHVAGLTKLHPELPAHLRGTYAGVAHPSIVDHLQQLEGDRPWNCCRCTRPPPNRGCRRPADAITGDIPRCRYFAVASRLRLGHPDRRSTEFAAMVDTLHAAGIEVILDVVYNHTCEGGPDLPVELSWRGLAPETYYLPPGQDITGTGNTVDPRSLTVVRHGHRLAALLGGRLSGWTGSGSTWRRCSVGPAAGRSMPARRC